MRSCVWKGVAQAAFLGMCSNIGRLLSPYPVCTIQRWFKRLPVAFALYILGTSDANSHGMFAG